MRERSRPFRGFTLVELLVVIAIISLLAAMLLPVLAESRVVARRTACLSNLRQTLVAVRLYAEDHFEFPSNIAPGTDLFYESVGDFSGAPFWEGREGMPSHWRGHLIDRGYAKTGRAFGCASGIPGGYRQHWSMGNFREDSNSPEIWAAPPYIYLGPGVDCIRASTYHLGLWVNDRKPRSAKFSRSHPLFGECCYMPQAGDNPGLWRYHFHSRRPYYPHSGEPGWYPRQIDMNIGWTDGHVKSHVQPVPPGAAQLFEHDWTKY